MGFFQKIKDGLAKTRTGLTTGIGNVFKTFAKVDDAFFDELEEALLLGDVGAKTSSDLIENLRERSKKEKITDTAQLKHTLIDNISDILANNSTPFDVISPSVFLIIGVNGVGKTTTIGKLAHIYANDDKKVLVAAADTFRAAAIDQLEIWAKRCNVPLIKHTENSDPAAVVFDAVAAAKARNVDLLIIDTAGRLQNKKNLMEELRKISKIIVRDFPQAHTETLLVLDASTGQNALNQAEVFREIADITGIILTKLDGTARGGIIIPIKNELALPVRFVGVGEGIDDLQPFDATEFAAGLFGEEEKI